MSQPSPTLESSVVAICNANRRIVGTGFLVEGDLILTCAHVIETAGSEPDGTVQVMFRGEHEPRSAHVMPEWWSSPATDDVAVLRLESSLPSGAIPLTLGHTRACNGHTLRILGFPELPGGYEMAYAEGQIRGVVPHPDKQPMLQMDAQPIRRGMSGAPVLDLVTQRIVGMVSEYASDMPLEWATTGETLNRICPAVKLHLPQPIEDYLAAVREYCANLPYLTLHDIHPPKTLDEVYVPLKARPQLRRDERGGKEEPERRERDARRQQPLSIAEVMQSHDVPHVLILGEPGAGKSTLLRQMAERAWDAPQTIGLSEPHLPLLVPLRHLVASDGSLEKRLGHALASDMPLAYDLPEGYLAQWSQQANVRWLILLDALDEVSDTERARLMQWLKGQLSNLREHRVVITSRPTGYKDDFSAKDFGHYDLLPFTVEQIGKFARKWFTNRADAFLKDTELMRAGDLYGTPLLLTIAAKVFGERGTLPERRSALYEQFINIWLNEARQRDKVQSRNELTERLWDMSLFVLAQLALAMAEHPEQVSEQFLTDIVVDYVCDALHFSRDEAETQSRKLVRILSRRSGVFVRRGDRYEFVHSTFFEYLVAFAVVRQSKDDIDKVWWAVISRWAESGWREKALFALSLLSESGYDVSSLVQRIWAHGGYAGLYFTWIALAQYIKVSESFGIEVINDILVRAHEMPRWSSLSFPDPVTLLYALQRYPRALEALLELACDPTINTLFRMKAAEALDRLSDPDRGDRAWLSLARDTGVDAWARVKATERVGQRNGDEASRILLTVGRERSLVVRVRVKAIKALEPISKPALSVKCRHDPNDETDTNTVRRRCQLGTVG